MKTVRISAAPLPARDQDSGPEEAQPDLRNRVPPARTLGVVLRRPFTSVLTRLSVKSTLERGATGSKDVNPEPPRELVFRSAT